MNKTIIAILVITFILGVGFISAIVIAESGISTAASDLVDYINSKLGIDLGTGKTVSSLGITNATDVKKYLYKWGSHLVIEWKDTKMKTNITSIIKSSDISLIDKNLTAKDFNNLPTWWRVKPARVP